MGLKINYEVCRRANCRFFSLKYKERWHREEYNRMPDTGLCTGSTWFKSTNDEGTDWVWRDEGMVPENCEYATEHLVSL